jgi:hypothetical protein
MRMATASRVGVLMEGFSAMRMPAAMERQRRERRALR